MDWHQHVPTRRPSEISIDVTNLERRQPVTKILRSGSFRGRLENIFANIAGGKVPPAVRRLQNNVIPASQVEKAIKQMNQSNLQSSIHQQQSFNVIPVNDLVGVGFDRYSLSEKHARCKLASLYRVIERMGWSFEIYNHISLRAPGADEHFLLNAFGLHYSEVTASNLVKVDIHGDLIDPGSTQLGINKAGYVIHSAIHEARADIKCIIHLHTSHGAGVSAMLYGLLPLCQEAQIVGGVSYHAYRGIVCDEAEKAELVQDLGPVNKAMILHNHGLLAMGSTVEEAYHICMNLVAACETQVMALSAGLSNVLLVNDDVVKKVFNTVWSGGGGGVSRHRRLQVGALEYEAMMRVLDNLGYNTGYPYKIMELLTPPTDPMESQETKAAKSSTSGDIVSMSKQIRQEVKRLRRERQKQSNLLPSDTPTQSDTITDKTPVSRYPVDLKYIAKHSSGTTRPVISGAILLGRNPHKTTMEPPVHSQDGGTMGPPVQLQDGGTMGPLVHSQDGGTMGPPVQLQDGGTMRPLVQSQDRGTMGPPVQLQDGGTMRPLVQSQDGGTMGPPVQLQDGGRNVYPTSHSTVDGMNFPLKEAHFENDSGMMDSMENPIGGGRESKGRVSTADGHHESENIWSFLEERQSQGPLPTTRNETAKPRSRDYKSESGSRLAFGQSLRHPLETVAHSKPMNSVAENTHPSRGGNDQQYTMRWAGEDDQLSDVVLLNGADKPNDTNQPKNGNSLPAPLSTPIAHAIPHDHVYFVPSPPKQKHKRHSDEQLQTPTRESPTEDPLSNEYVSHGPSTTAPRNLNNPDAHVDVTQSQSRMFPYVNYSPSMMDRKQKKMLDDDATDGSHTSVNSNPSLTDLRSVTKPIHPNENRMYQLGVEPSPHNSNGDLEALLKVEETARAVANSTGKSVGKLTHLREQIPTRAIEGLGKEQYHQPQASQGAAAVEGLGKKQQLPADAVVELRKEQLQTTHDSQEADTDSIATMSSSSNGHTFNDWQEPRKIAGERNGYLSPMENNSSNENHSINSTDDSDDVAKVPLQSHLKPSHTSATQQSSYVYTAPMLDGNLMGLEKAINVAKRVAESTEMSVEKLNKSSCTVVVGSSQNDDDDSV